MLKVILSCSFFCNQRKKEYFCHERKLLAYRINKMIWNPNKECMSREQMSELQGKRLHKIVKYVYHNVPFYRNKLQELDITPDDIRTLARAVGMDYDLLTSDELPEDFNDRFSTAVDNLYKLRNIYKHKPEVSDASTNNPTA